MNPEESLLAYLYPRLVEAIQTWKGFDDIYGIWLFIGLADEYRSQTELTHALVIRDICGQLIHRVHTDGTLKMFFGQAVPIGIFFNNDLPAKLALPVTRDSNPLGLADEMLDWLRGHG